MQTDQVNYSFKIFETEIKFTMKFSENILDIVGKQEFILKNLRYQQQELVKIYNTFNAIKQTDYAEMETVYKYQQHTLVCFGLNAAILLLSFITNLNRINFLDQFLCFYFCMSLYLEYRINIFFILKQFCFLIISVCYDAFWFLVNFNSKNYYF